MMHRKKSSVFVMFLLWVVGIIGFLRNFSIVFSISLFQKIFNISSKKKFSEILKNNIWNFGRKDNYFSSLFFDAFNNFNHRLKVIAASSQCLSLLYNFDYQRGVSTMGIKSSWIKKINNPRAVVNRKDIIVRKLINLFSLINKDEIRLVSFASGSATAVIEAVMAFNQKKNVLVTLIDSDENALGEAKRVVDSLGLEKNFTFIKKDVYFSIKSQANQSIDIVEMAGFLDYLEDETVIRYLTRIRKEINPKYFVSCNILPNPEKIFVDWVLLWPMKYRAPELFRKLLEDSGFSSNEIIIEPLGVHLVSVSS